jgi:predicted O-methyltransferase YrrM
MDAPSATNSAITNFVGEVNDTRDQIYASRPLLLEYVLKNSRPGDIQNVIDTIDNFARTQQWLMNIGDKKGEILDNTVRSRQPKTVLELGKDTF